MIMLWASISILTLLILAILALPLLRKQNDKKLTASDYDVAVYKSQLAEIDREVARGAFTPDEADAARGEIARRLMAADAKSKTLNQTAEPTSQSSMKFIAIVLVLLVAVASITLYLELGSPEMLANPLASRDAERVAAQTAAETAGGMDDVVKKLEEKLAEKPDSIDGWMLLGRSYLTIGQLDKSLDAYEKAIELDRGHQGLLSTYGEVMVMQAQGGVLEPMMAIFKEALALDGKDVRAQFYLAQGTYQVGRPKEALDAYVALANSGPADAPWQALVQEAAQEIANELEINISNLMPEIPVSNGPDADDMAAAAEMSAGDRQAMIEGMVAKLSEKLKEEPDNLEGWMRLGQSYTVLGRFEDSASAYSKASALSPENPEILLMLGRALRGQNSEASFKQARVVMDQVLAIDSNNLEALWMVGIDEADLGNKEAASTYFDKALQLVGKTSADYIELRMEADGILSKIK